MTPDKIKKKVKRGIIAHRWLVFPRFWLNEEFLRLLITPEVSLIWSFVQMLKKNEHAPVFKSWLSYWEQTSLYIMYK